LWEHYGRADYGDWQGDDKTTALDGELEPDATSGAGTGANAPVVVGVRLRRVVIVTDPARDDR
jgi:hypothetical protein